MAELAVNKQATFLWEGKDKKGNRVKGRGLARDEMEIRSDLRKQGIAATRVRKESKLFPVTGLPEGSIVEEKLKECLDSRGWAFLSVGIKHLDDFREDYGFVASDDTLRAISLMVTNTVRDLGEADDFVGHLSQTVLIVATHSTEFQSIKVKIKSRLEQSLDYFYPLKNRRPETHTENRLSIRLVEAAGVYTELSDLLSVLAGASRG